MLPIHLLGWWYSQGWSWVIDKISWEIDAINDSFSVGIILKTLFSPWKQIQTEVTFKNFLQSKIDNFVSRMIGFFVRLGMLVGAIFLYLLVFLIGLITIVAWPFLPILVIALPVISIFGGL